MMTGRFRREIFNSASLSFAVGAAILVAVSGCQPRIDARGNLPDPDVVVKIQPGVQTRQQVADMLGSPSAVGTFDDKSWYYISKRTETIAFFEPDVVDQEVLEVKFDDAGVVSDVRVFGPDDARKIEPVDRETPTSGQELTILQQLLGNVGRFNKDTGTNPRMPGGRPGTVP